MQVLPGSWPRFLVAPVLQADLPNLVRADVLLDELEQAGLGVAQSEGIVRLDDQRVSLDAHGRGVAGERLSDDRLPLDDRAPACDLLRQAEPGEHAREERADGGRGTTRTWFVRGRVRAGHQTAAGSGRRSGMIRHSTSSEPSESAPSGSTMPALIEVLSRNRTFSVSIVRRMSRR